METIIEEQEKEFKVLQEAKEWFYNWHKEKVKQILQALVEREEKQLMKFTPGEASLNGQYDVTFEDPSSVYGFNKAKQDTIQYLQEQIKKL